MADAPAAAPAESSGDKAASKGTSIASIASIAVPVLGIAAAAGSALLGYRSAKAAKEAQRTNDMINAISAAADAKIAEMSGELSFMQGQTNARIARLQGEAISNQLTSEFNRVMASNVTMAMAQGRSGESVKGMGRAAEHQYNWDKDFTKLSSEIEAISADMAGRAGQATANIQGMSIMAQGQRMTDTSQFDNAGLQAAFGFGSNVISMFSGGGLSGLLKSAPSSSNGSKSMATTGGIGGKASGSK